jgi:hypothetical protein
MFSTSATHSFGRASAYSTPVWFSQLNLGRRQSKFRSANFCLGLFCARNRALRRAGGGGRIERVSFWQRDLLGSLSITHIMSN